MLSQIQLHSHVKQEFHYQVDGPKTNAAHRKLLCSVFDRTVKGKLFPFDLIKRNLTLIFSGIDGTDRKWKRAAVSSFLWAPEVTG
jgi:hypothetical protein